MIMIVWIFNKDPGTSIMVAVSYYLTVHYLMKNCLKRVAETGVVTREIALMISGGSGPTIKPASVVQSEAALMQASVNQQRAPGFVTTPEALLSSGPVSTAAVAAILCDMGEENITVPVIQTFDRLSAKTCSRAKNID